MHQDVRIGIIGDGVVGGALRQWFASRRHYVRSYDPPKGLRDRSAIDNAGIVFVCVPTPYHPDRGFDASHLLDAVSSITGEKVVVIKSTVLPGTTGELQARFPRHRFAFNPEFLREATALDDMLHPGRQIVGTTPRSQDVAPAVLAMLPPAPFARICPAREAEMAKYVANSFLAVKVSFANEIFDLCERLGIDYAGMAEIVAADPRIGASHMDVLDGGYRGYGGKCLPKDSKSLLDLAAAAGIELDVLRAAGAVNERLLAPAVSKPARRPAEVPELPSVETGRRAA